MQAQAVKEYLTKERRAQRLIGLCHDIQDLCISRAGVMPKGYTLGKWRVITNLSHPGVSDNNGINPVFGSMPYVTVDR